jgi:hypothetical protein
MLRSILPFRGKSKPRVSANDCGSPRRRISKALACVARLHPSRYRHFVDGISIKVEVQAYVRLCN